MDGMTGQTQMRVLVAERQEHVCPECGHKGFCDVSPHLFFAEDKLALRCAKCRHVWALEGDTK